MPPPMFETFTPFAIPTSTSPAVTIHGIHGGSGPALLLLHGFPQTHHIWHLITPSLLATYTIIALDLRGYGASSKPTGVSHYAKSAMAQDCLAVMTALGHARFYICAHDRGARVAHKLLVDAPHRVRRALLLDICPTRSMYARTTFAFARAYFHWFYLIQESPLPETGILADPDLWMEKCMGGRDGKVGLRKFDERCVAVYRASLSDPACVHAMCEDYRAAASVDLEEAEADLDAGRRIRTRLRVLWGRHGVVEMCFDALKEWREVCDEGVEVTGEAVDCGHYIPEEAPDEVVRHIKEFFVEDGE